MQGKHGTVKPMKKNHSITRKNLPQSRVRLTIPVTAAIFRPAFDAELTAIAKDTKIEGFRPGKAPKNKVLSQVGRQRVEAGALDRALNTAYVNALKEEALTAVAMPEVALDSYTAPEADADADMVVATFTAEVDVLPEVSIKGYDKLKIKQPALREVGENDLDEVLTYLRKQQVKMLEVAEGTKAAKGMWVDIAFEGSVDGVAREDMKTEHHPVVLGENTLIPGFEDEIIGLTAGEEKQFTITFPKDYHAQELQGKKAQFKINVHEIKDMQLPVVDDSFAKQFGVKDVAELEKNIKRSLQQEREAEQRSKTEELVLEALLKLARFEIPASLKEQEEQRLRENTMKQLHGQPLPETLASQIPEQAEKNVRIGLMLGKVIEAEEISGDDDAMRKALERLIAIATR